MNSVRKSLKILGAGLIAVSSSLLVVACTDDSDKRFDTAGLPDEIKDSIMFEINSNQNIFSEGVSFEDIFTDEEQSDTAVRLLDQTISQFYFQTTQENTWSYYLSDAEDADQISWGTNYSFDKIFQSWVENIATDKLYSDYLNGINSHVRLETQMSGYLKSSDAIKDLGINGEYYVPYDNDTHMPTGEKGETNSAATKSEDDVKAWLTDGTIPIDTVKIDLKNWFYDYYIHKEVPDVLDYILTAIYLENDLITNYEDSDTGDKGISINKNGNLLSSMQSWDDINDTDDSITSNFKMVWAVKTDSSYNIDDNSNTYIDDTKVDGENWTPDNLKTQLDGIDKDPTANEKDRNGGDPIWGIDHFQGFAALDDTGAIVNTDYYKGNEVYLEQVADANEAGWLINENNPGGNNKAFATDGNEYYYVYVLPIYPIDLFSGLTIGYNKNADDPSKGFLSDEIDLKAINGSNGKSTKSLDWNKTTSKYDKNGHEVKYLHDYKAPINNDITAGLGTVVKDGDDGINIYGDDGNFNDGIDATKLQLLRWAEFSFAQESSLQEHAKTNLYSWAFDYDPDNIWSKTLYDAIGSYVESDYE